MTSAPPPAAEIPESFRRVCALLAGRGHARAPRFLASAVRTAQQAADALGVGVGQIAKSIVFRRLGGVVPLGYPAALTTLVDRELFRFDQIWAAAGHPNGAFRLTPHELPALTGAAAEDLAA